MYLQQFYKCKYYRVFYFSDKIGQHTDWTTYRTTNPYMSGTEWFPLPAQSALYRSAPAPFRVFLFTKVRETRSERSWGEKTNTDASTSKSQWTHFEIMKIKICIFLRNCLSYEKKWSSLHWFLWSLKGTWWCWIKYEMGVKNIQYFNAFAFPCRS